MSNGWTGAQYSLLRIGLAVYLILGSAFFAGAALSTESGEQDFIPLFPGLLDLPAPWGGAAALGLWIAAALLLLLGRLDRAAVILLLYVLASIVDAGWVAADRGLVAIAVALIAHTFVPAAPYGSLSARGRIDPRGDWRMPGAIRLAVWDATALGLVFLGAAGLIQGDWPGSPAAIEPAGMRVDLALGLVCLLLTGIARARRFIWIALLLWNVWLIALDPGWSAWGMLPLTAFLFDPAWIPPRGQPASETIFYDGHCGLCRRSVRFVLAEDRAAVPFRFAPLQSDRFRQEVDDAERERLPDSIAVRAVSGTLLVRSSAALYVLARLGGIWRPIAALARAVPRPLRDAVYDIVALIRHNVFRRPANLCPRLPPDLASRFDG